MKHKTALKQSIAHSKTLGCVALVMVVVSIIWPGRAVFLALGIVVFLLLCETFNVFRIKRKAKSDPDFLEKKIQ